MSGNSVVMLRSWVDILGKKDKTRKAPTRKYLTGFPTTKIVLLSTESTRNREKN